MATERENRVSMTLLTDLKLNSVKSSLVSNAPSGQIQSTIQYDFGDSHVKREKFVKRVR